MCTLFKSIKKPSQFEKSQRQLAIGLYTPVFDGINLYVHLDFVSAEEAQKLWGGLEDWLQKSNAMASIPDTIASAMESGYAHEQEAMENILKIEEKMYSEMCRVGMMR